MNKSLSDRNCNVFLVTRTIPVLQKLAKKKDKQDLPEGKFWLISIKKTKVLSIGYEQARILLDGFVLENVTEFTYFEEYHESRWWMHC